MVEIRFRKYEFTPAVRTEGLSWISTKGFDLLSYDTLKLINN